METRRRRKKWKRRLKGGYTVEAAFLVPLGIEVILFVISVTLFLYDRTAACAWVHETAQREGFQKGETDWRDFLPEVLITRTEESVERGKERVTVICKGEGQFFSVLKGLFSFGEPGLETYEQVTLLYGEQAVRLRGLVEGVYKGGSRLQERSGP